MGRGGSVKRGECEEGGLVSGGTGLAGVIGFFLAYPQSNLNHSYYSM